MRPILFALVASIAVFVAPALGTVSPIVLALASVGAGVLLASISTEEFSPLAIAAGALGALAFSMLRAESAALAFGAWFAAVHAPRALRANRGKSESAVLVAIALACGAGAALVDAHFVGATLLIHATAACVVGLLVAAPMLWPVDDPLTHDLLHTARVCAEPARALLLRAAILRRRFGETDWHGAPSEVRDRVETAWRTLRGIASVRVGSAGRAAERMDERVRAIVAGLERTYAAAEESLANAATMSDRTTQDLRTCSEVLETEASAYAEATDDGESPPVPASPARADVDSAGCAGYACATVAAPNTHA